jgi:hypothetical protein
MAIAAVVAAVVSVVVAIVYFAMGHVKHGIAFIGLAGVALMCAWFTSAPEPETVESSS